jgi:hypothetical protein
VCRLALHEDQDPSDADLLAEAGAISPATAAKVIVRCDEVYRSPSGKVDYQMGSDKVREA